MMSLRYYVKQNSRVPAKCVLVSQVYRFIIYFYDNELFHGNNNGC
jgi:hypothetical protein